MIIKYDYISRKTEKAILIVKDDVFAWLPKSVVLAKGVQEMEIKDSFLVEWKDESYKIVRTDGGISDSGCDGSVGREARQIVVNDGNRDLLWEYI